MKWTRAVHHIEALAAECAKMLPNKINPLRVTRLWAFGQVIRSQEDLDWVDVALSVDLPEVPWLSNPTGSTHWSRGARLKEPLRPFWRSAHAPVWNHAIVQPILIWDADDGLIETAVTALREDKVDTVRIPRPSKEELAKRVADELAISLKATRGRVRTYEEKRWAPGKLEPLADDLWAVTKGYLDLLDGPRR
jgi:hypothetical protein